jgi:hypothetical protein
MAKFVPAAQAQVKTSAFDPEGSGFDMATAKASGMKPYDVPGPDYGHWGSVTPTTKEQQAEHGLDEDSYMILKGRDHKKFQKAVDGESKRGFEVKKIGNRYYSVRKRK